MEKHDQTEEMEASKLVYKKGTERVLLLSSILLVISIFLIGTLVYVFAEKEVVRKLKEKDLIYIGESISAKIDEQIFRAKETSLILANDPAVYEWVSSGEEKEELEGYAVEKLKQLATEFEYNNSFIVSAVTGHYWSEKGEIVEVMDSNNPLNSWFYEAVSSNQKVAVNFDYNSSRNDTFVFVNALMGEVQAPIAVVGVGFSLQKLSNDFNEYKYVDNSNLWLIDKEGNIYLSDNADHNGTSIENYVPLDVKSSLSANFDDETAYVMEYEHDGQLIDLISYPIASTDWKLIFQIPREETVSFLQTIKYNSFFAMAVYLLSIIFIFYYVSRKIANPYKLALKVNQQLEEKVAERTRELMEKNDKLSDSIDYAKRIQENLFPREELFKNIFDEHFLVWLPRDKVGGDFYWLKETKDGYLFAIGDCTGHGVPGALMTMLTISNLNYIVEQESEKEPSRILQQLNKSIKKTLKQETKSGLTDDGLDIGLIYFRHNHSLSFAGAKCSLYIKNEKELKIIKGDRKSVGYRRTDSNYEFQDTLIHLNKDDVLYMTTDGYVDQNGENDQRSFGRSNFLELIEKHYNKPIGEQKEIFLSAINSYMGNESQRDDITLFACKFNSDLKSTN